MYELLAAEFHAAGAAGPSAPAAADDDDDEAGLFAAHALHADPADQGQGQGEGMDAMGSHAASDLFAMDDGMKNAMRHLSELMYDDERDDGEDDVNVTQASGAVASAEAGDGADVRRVFGTAAPSVHYQQEVDEDDMADLRPLNSKGQNVQGSVKKRRPEPSSEAPTATARGAGGGKKSYEKKAKTSAGGGAKKPSGGGGPGAKAHKK